MAVPAQLEVQSTVAQERVTGSMEGNSDAPPGFPFPIFRQNFNTNTHFNPVEEETIMSK